MASCKVVLFCFFGYSCCVFCSSLRSVLFVVIMCIAADYSYSLFPRLSLTPSHPFALTLCRVFGSITEQSLVILYSHNNAHSSPHYFCAVDANAHQTLLNFVVALFLQLKCRRQKRDTVTLKSNCGVTQRAQPGCGSLASFLCLWEL